jgi:hypothetical protein
VVVSEFEAGVAVLGAFGAALGVGAGDGVGAGEQVAGLLAVGGVGEFGEFGVGVGQLAGLLGGRPRVASIGAGACRRTRAFPSVST